MKMAGFGHTSTTGRGQHDQRMGQAKVVLAGMLLALAVAACGLGRDSSSGSNTNALAVINQTGIPLCSVRIKKASAQTFWGRNRLETGERLEPGETLTIGNLPAGYYDVDAHRCDDGSHPGYGRYDVQVGQNLDAVWSVGQ